VTSDVQPIDTGDGVG